MSKPVTKQETTVVPACRISATTGRMVVASPSVGSPSERMKRTDSPGKLADSVAILIFPSLERLSHRSVAEHFWRHRAHVRQVISPIVSKADHVNGALAASAGSQ